MSNSEKSDVLAGLTSYWTDRTHSYSEQNVEEMNDWRRDAWRDLILENAPSKERLKVLDIGCGPGFFPMIMALAGHDVTAVDVTDHMIFHARKNAESYGAKVRFVVNRGESLPFEDSSFDLILSRNVVWNLEYPEKAFSEWMRVLNPGGRIVYFDANWYLYLFDEDLRLRREEHMQSHMERYPGTEEATGLPPERIKDLETIAYSLPLSRELRPKWDVEALRNIGMNIVSVDENTGRRVQDPVEYERDLVTPLFMICAEKD